MTLGEKIQSLRKKDGMTQEQLAEHLSITRQTISKWELGESEPAIAHLIQLSEIFQVTTDDLLKNVPTNSEKHMPKGKATLMVGVLLLVLGLLSTLTFWVLSIVRPAEFHVFYIDDPYAIRRFTGLLGFLYTWNAWGLFGLTVATWITGAGILLRRGRHKIKAWWSSWGS